MSGYGEVIAQGVVRFTRLLPGPIERVWEYLVDSDRRGEWFCRGVTEPRAGGRVELRFKHSELSNVQEEIPAKYKSIENGCDFVGVVLEFEPPRRLSYTWEDKDGPGSQVTFELTPQGEDVLLVLTHSRLPNRGEVVGVSGGWHTHLDVLEDRLRGRAPNGFWARHQLWADAYEARIPRA